MKNIKIVKTIVVIISLIILFFFSKLVGNGVST